jgi:hypothetical protein
MVSLLFRQEIGALKQKQIIKARPWHEAVLKDREEALASGKSAVSDWEQAKRGLRKKLRWCPAFPQIPVCKFLII